jgi:hypothetical protein
MIPMFPWILGTTFDDELMVWMTRNILDGKWVGDYSSFGHLILSKPPGYPLFLAGIHWIPISPTNFVHMLLLLASALLVRELRLLAIPRNRCLVYFSAIAFYPPWFNEEMSRIYRDGFLALIALSSIVSILAIRRRIINFQSEPNVIHAIKLLIPSIIHGVLIGWFVITKPSWHILTVFSIAIFISFIFSNRRSLKVVLSAVVISLASIAIGSGVVITTIVKINHYEYGVSVVDTFANGSFPSALKVLYGINDTENRAYVDVTKAMRNEGYRVSPTLRKLRPYLEQPNNTGWRGVACGFKQLGKICDESSAWFPWDFRAAIQSAGLGHTAIEFEETNQRITLELVSACQNKKIQCENPGLAPGLDSLDSLSWRNVIDAMFIGVDYLSDAEFGKRNRFSQPGEYLGVETLWKPTINGFPQIEYSSDLEINSQSLQHVRLVWSKLYQLVLNLGILGLLVGLIIPAKKFKSNQECSSLMRIIAIGGLASVSLLIFQVSLLEASSGLYMSDGGRWYLLPATPFVLVALIAGVERLAIMLEPKLRNFNQRSSGVKNGQN